MKNNNSIFNIDNVLVFIILVVLSIGNLLVVINQQLRENYKLSMDKNIEDIIILIIKTVFLLITIYFFVQTYQSIIEYQRKDVSGKVIASQKRQLIVTTLTLIGAIINLTVLNIDPEDLFE